MAKVITLEELVAREGGIAQAHRWIVKTTGLDISYHTLLRWLKKGRPSSVYVKVFADKGIKISLRSRK